MVTMGAVLLAGSALTSYEGRQEENNQRAFLRTLAEHAAAGIERPLLATLTGAPADMNTPGYTRLKRQLARMREATPRGRFVYVMVERDGEVVFLADSEPHESEDCSLPGTVYEDASDELRQLLREGGSTVEGPLPDEWGTWVSGLATADDPADGRVLALVGVDVNASDFMAAVRAVRLRAAGLVAAVCLLLGALAVFDHRMGRASEALQQSQKRLALHAEQTMLGLIEMGPDMRVTAWNEAAQRIFGFTAEEAIGRNALELIVPQAVRPRVQHVLRDMFVTRRCMQNTNDNLTRDGRIITCEWCNTPLVDGRGQVVAITSLVQDVSDRAAMEEQLRRAATTDRLTGLPNRALLLDRLGQAMRRHRRDPNNRFALLFLDFDRFKIINDSLGHEVGDLLLTQIAERLAGELRDVDSISRAGAVVDGEDVAHTAGRLGGDEFVVLLEGIRHADSAAIVADRLLAAIARPFACAGHELFCTASIGIVTSDLVADRPEELLRDADTAMYEAKLAGKGRYAVFDVSMRRRVQQRLELENDLRRAVAGDMSEQFALAFQPIISLETSRVDNFEVLVRWRHPVRGMISPAEFIPIAEETGLIVPLGDWIVRQACEQLAAWRRLRPDTAPASLSVNLSRRQLIQPDLPELLAQIVADAGIQPAFLHLEITESAVMQDAEHASRVLSDLKAAGFRLAMDDFGTGYSSLACLHQFPLDVLKVDRSFVANLCRGRDFAALVNAIVMLARSLGIAVVAEGVETPEQALLLQTMDCQHAQGYLFGKPMPIDDAMSFRTRPFRLNDAAA